MTRCRYAEEIRKREESYRDYEMSRKEWETMDEGG